MGAKPANSYRNVRFKLFAINIGALVSIMGLLLIVVYSLMAHELYQVLDDQLRSIGEHLIHSYDRGQTSYADTLGFGEQDLSFSLWRILRQHAQWTAEFVDGNPFIDVRTLYEKATAAGHGLFFDLTFESVKYRAFTAIVPAQQGLYLIRVMEPTAGTDSTLASLVWTLVVAGVGALALTIGIALWLASRSMAPMITAWQKQQQFVADASHELRTPLAIIKTNLDILLRNPSHQIQEEIHYLGNAYAEVMRTGSLIEDLLTLARADSQEQLIDKRPVNMSDLLHQVTEAVQPMAEEQEKTIQTETPNAPCTTLGDIGRLRQLLLILIDNALRYTAPGATITLQLECDTLRTTIHVSDTGVGIEPALLPKVFDRFVRGDAARHRESKGSGLGLSIAKWIVDAHNGDISVRSVIGVGTTFTITLPQ